MEEECVVRMICVNVLMVLCKVFFCDYEDSRGVDSRAYVVFRVNVVNILD